MSRKVTEEVALEVEVLVRDGVDDGVGVREGVAVTVEV